MWITPTEFSVKLGGNYFINTPNMIVAHGENLFQLKRRDADGLLAIDFDVYAADGSKAATIRNGNIVQGDSARYEMKKEHHRYWMVDRESGRILVDVRKAAKAEDGSELEVSVDLYTKKGMRIIAGPEQTNFGNVMMRNCRITNCGAGISVE